MGSLGWKETVNVSSRLYLSLQHIQSAALFARHSGRIERGYDGSFSGKLLTEYLAYVTASIFTASAFLEARINEFFADAGEEYGENPLDSDTKKLLAEEWKSISKDYSINMMDKFDKALKVVGKPVFNRGEKPAQDVVLVVRLRNTLTHYEPEWINDVTEDLSMVATKKKPIKSLLGKFSISPLMDEKNPYKFLNYDCARWAVRSSLAYSDEFYARLEKPAPYEHIRKDLAT